MSVQPNETAQLEFRPGVLRDALRHQIVLIAVVSFALGAVGVLFTLVRPVARSSSATVLIQPLTGNPYSDQATGDQLTNLESEAQLVATDAVATIAAKKLKASGPASGLIRSVRGTLQDNTQVIKVTATDTDGDVAQRRAQAFAEAYLLFRQQTATTQIAGTVALLEQQETATRKLLQTALTNSAKESTRALATEQVKQYSAELTRLTSAIGQEQAITTSPGQVITPATHPGGRALSVLALGALGGVLAGLVIGVLAAITRERLDDRVRDTTDLDRLSITSLGSMNLTAGWSPHATDLPEDHRRVRTALMTALPAVPATIVVGRPDASGIAPSIVGPLAVALARSGVRVCVVDSAVTDWLGQELVPNTEGGLAAVLLQDLPIEQTLRQPLPGLGVVPRGRWSVEAADQLGNIRMRRAVKQLRRYFDIVLISTPSMQNADGQVLARMADGVVLEASAMSTTNADLLQTTEQLARAQVPVLGSVLLSRGTPRRQLRASLPGSATGPAVPVQHATAPDPFAGRLRDGHPPAVPTARPRPAGNQATPSGPH